MSISIEDSFQIYFFGVTLLWVLAIIGGNISVAVFLNVVQWLLFIGGATIYRNQPEESKK